MVDLSDQLVYSLKADTAVVFFEDLQQVGCALMQQ